MTKISTARPPAFMIAVTIYDWPASAALVELVALVPSFTVVLTAGRRLRSGTMHPTWPADVGPAPVTAGKAPWRGKRRSDRQSPLPVSDALAWHPAGELHPARRQHGSKSSGATVLFPAAAAAFVFGQYALLLDVPEHAYPLGLHRQLHLALAPADARTARAVTVVTKEGAHVRVIHHDGMTADAAQ